MKSDAHQDGCPRAFSGDTGFFGDIRHGRHRFVEAASRVKPPARAAAILGKSSAN